MKLCVSGGRSDGNECRNSDAGSYRLLRNDLLIGILRKERRSKLDLIGSMIRVVGVIAFQIV